MEASSPAKNGPGKPATREACHLEGASSLEILGLERLVGREDRELGGICRRSKSTRTKDYDIMMGLVGEEFVMRYEMSV